jgi:hypothetical protein
VKKCNEVRKEQERIWKLRVAELENAIIEAKRAKMVRAEHRKKMIAPKNMALPEREIADAPKDPPGVGFFRQPKSEVHARVKPMPHK